MPRGIGWMALCLWAPLLRAATISFPLPDTPATLDWTSSVTTTEGPIVHLIAEGLYRYDYPSGKLVPAIAESLEKSKDFREYTFHLRKDAKWSDGVPVRSQDFLDGWLRVLSPGSTSLYNFYFFDIENALAYFQKNLTDGGQLGIRAKDDHTLVVRLARPIRNWEATTAFWPLFPVRKDLIAKHGTSAWKPGVLPSTGPFVLTSLEAGKSLELRKNPLYRITGSNVDRVNVLFDRDPRSLLEKFRKGRYSFVSNLGAEQKKQFHGSPRLREVPILRNHVLVTNAEKFPMSSRDFRKALFLALDRKRILEKSGIAGSLAKSLVPVSLSGSSGSLIPENNPPQAKRSLDSAGVVRGKGFQLRLLTRIDPANVRVATEIQEQLQGTLGIPVEVEALHEKEFSMMANMNEYDLILVGWSAKLRTPEDFLRPYSRLASNSRLRFNSPVFLELLEEGLGASSPKEAQEAFRKAQVEYLQNEAVILPLIDERLVVLQQPGLKNLYFDHMGFPVLTGLTVASDPAEGKER